MTGFVLAGSGLPTVADGTPLPPSAADSGPTSETFAIAGEGAPLSAASDRADETIRSLNESLRSAERTRILEALQRSGGNQRLAAAELGISRFTLMKRMEQYGIVRPRKR
jgi:DNA-binding NtrC family response regulator